ncbi:MAG: GNAT family N-acetyltransferase, partial [Planctomycetota bacterium]
MTTLRGSRVALRPATEADRASVYAWLARSDLTPSMMGPPQFPDHPVPTWEEFCADYKPHYFDDSLPQAGRCFIIVVDDEDVGVVGYNRIDPTAAECELDIWLRSERDCGRGYGSDAPITVHFLMLKTSADGAKKRGSNLRRDDNRGIKVSVHA